jgi:hypothetical protein
MQGVFIANQLSTMMDGQGGMQGGYCKPAVLPHCCCCLIMQGVFIANQLSTMMDGQGGMGGMGGMGMKRTVFTRITFNGGGSWQPIKAPTTFNNQKCNRCGGAANCALHLHGESCCLS